MNDIFKPEYFKKQDPSDDANFYQIARKVVHIDDHAIAGVRDLFAEMLPPNGTYLDLMSSWRSHLPSDLNPTKVVGLGMNAEEMSDNPQLDEYVVHNLNRKPILPFGDATFDAAFCTVSVQYLTQPREVFREVERVLRPGGVFIVSFSNRCFPTKAVAIWLSMNNEQHVELVKTYFAHGGNWVNVDHRAKLGKRTLFGGDDPLYLVWGFTPS